MEQDNNNALMFEGVFPSRCFCSLPGLCQPLGMEGEPRIRGSLPSFLWELQVLGCAQNSDRNEWGETRMCGQHRPGREQRRREGNTPLKLKGV